MKRVITAFVLALSLLVLGATAAFGAASPQASCNGIGSSTETLFFGAGARADISFELIQLAKDQGTTPGAIYAFFAAHLGSVEACFG
jgi:hypothetical protein